jgi:hypothetical protein
MVARRSGVVGEALFIHLGMRKEKWSVVTVEMIQSFLDDPSLLDDNENWDDFIECFYKYHQWYWREQKLK